MSKLVVFLFLISLIYAKNVLENKTKQVVEPDVEANWLSEDENAPKCKLQPKSSMSLRFQYFDA